MTFLYAHPTAPRQLTANIKVSSFSEIPDTDLRGVQSDIRSATAPERHRVHEASSRQPQTTVLHTMQTTARRPGCRPQVSFIRNHTGI